jgi:hypothetical protein
MEWQRSYGNGTAETKFYNGTWIKETEYADGTITLKYIKAPIGYAYMGNQGDTMTIKFNNGTERFYREPPTDDWTDQQKAYAVLYEENYIDGTFLYAYRNGTIVLYNNDFRIN